MIPADADPDRKSLLALKLIQESEKHIYFLMVSMYCLFYGVVFGAWLATIQIYARLLAPNCPSRECYKGTTGIR
jgi:hypothetical protein